MVASLEDDESCKKSKSVSSAAKADWLLGGYVGAEAPTPIRMAELDLVPTRYGGAKARRSTREHHTLRLGKLGRSGAAPLQQMALLMRA